LVVRLAYSMKATKRPHIEAISIPFCR
jgi:hypothetical protein